MTVLWKLMIFQLSIMISSVLMTYLLLLCRWQLKGVKSEKKKICQKDEFLCESNALSVQNVWFWDDQANNFKQEIRIPKGQRSFIHLTLNTWWIPCNDIIQIYHSRLVFHWDITSVFQASHQRHGEWEEQGKNFKNSKEIKS